MSETNGLKTIVANTGTLHGITAPPDRREYATSEAYEAAYDAWYIRAVYWRSETRTHA